MNEMMMENTRNKEASKKVTFSLPDDSETEDVTDMQLEKTDDPSEIKSSFEKRQEKVIDFFILLFVWKSGNFILIFFLMIVYFESESGK